MARRRQWGEARLCSVYAQHSLQTYTRKKKRPHFAVQFVMYVRLNDLKDNIIASSHSETCNLTMLFVTCLVVATMATAVLRGDDVCAGNWWSFALRLDEFIMWPADVAHSGWRYLTMRNRIRDFVSRCVVIHRILYSKIDRKILRRNFGNFLYQ